MSLLKILQDTVAGLDECVQALASSFPPPLLADLSADQVGYRHPLDQRSDLLLSHLKLIKIASTNNAALLLLRAGFVQETLVLCRIMDEAYHDIVFMAEPHGDGAEPSKEQRRFIEEFYQEEHDDPDNPLSSSKRDRVPRKHIHAVANKWLPADVGARQTAIARTLYQTFSGYVHGSYVHIMELFWESQFRTRGMLGTLRIQECLGNHSHYVFRSLLAVELVAKHDVLSNAA